MNFTAYCDESYVDGGNRFRGVAAVSFPQNHETDFKTEITALLEESKVAEFKWNKLTNAKYRFAAEKLVHWSLRAVASQELRVDVLIWDTKDRRHSITGRDDNTNYERMFFHLLQATLRKRAPGAAWCVYPDDRAGVNWATLNDCLQFAGLRNRNSAPSLFVEFIRNGKYSIRRFLPVTSHEHPLVQVADLFCGLGVFSRDRYSVFAAWSAATGPQVNLFAPAEAQPQPTQTDTERFPVLRTFKEAADAARLGVSLASTQGLRTREPTRPFNFWWYEPQHANDRAPVRTRR